jgi:hypothetical protein
MYSSSVCLITTNVKFVSGIRHKFRDVSKERTASISRLKDTKSWHRARSNNLLVYHKVDTENYVVRSTETSKNFAGQYSSIVFIPIVTVS